MPRAALAGGSLAEAWMASPTKQFASPTPKHNHGLLYPTHPTEVIQQTNAVQATVRTIPLHVPTTLPFPY
jgi:hypothetical protein